MKFRNLNNACTLVESSEMKLLIDPWLFGQLYHGSWSVFDTYIHSNQSVIDHITHVFISHIHQDHWDIDTLNKINKDSIVLIPKYGFNNVIKNRVESLGFSDVQMIEVGRWFNIATNIEGYIIPPLNGMAQDIDWYEKKGQERPIAIDTGLIIKDSDSQTCHIILGDNTPYDITTLKEHLPNTKINTLWFPYNGFAQDYPLCYDDLSVSEKQKISLNMSLKREQSVVEAIKLIEPQYLIPHSSDFILNGKRKDEFLLVHDNEFLDKNKYAERIEKITDIPSYALFAKDYIQFKNDQVDILIDDDIKNTPNVAIDSITLSEYSNNQHIFELLDVALKNMVLRCERLNIPIDKFQDWQLKFILDNDTYFINFEEQIVANHGDNNKKTLTLITNKNVLCGILNRELHINNCEIGCFLTWNRQPNEFNKWLYNALNFLHL